MQPFDRLRGLEYSFQDFIKMCYCFWMMILIPFESDITPYKNASWTSFKNELFQKRLPFFIPVWSGNRKIVAKFRENWTLFLKLFMIDSQENCCRIQLNKFICWVRRYFRDRDKSNIEVVPYSRNGELSWFLSKFIF